MPEEALQAEAGGFFERVAEVVGLDGLALHAVDVEAEPVEEDLVPELGAEHVEDARALRIGVGAAPERLHGWAYSLEHMPGVKGASARSLETTER